MSPRAWTVLRVVVAGAVFAMTGVAAYLAELHPEWGPVLVPLSTGLSTAIAHRLGVPMRAVLEQALQRMQPDAKEQITRRVLESMPPPMAARVISSMAPPSIVFERESMNPAPKKR